MNDDVCCMISRILSFFYGEGLSSFDECSKNAARSFQKRLQEAGVVMGV